MGQLIAPEEVNFPISTLRSLASKAIKKREKGEGGLTQVSREESKDFLNKICFF